MLRTRSSSSSLHSILALAFLGTSACGPEAGDGGDEASRTRAAIGIDLTTPAARNFQNGTYLPIVEELGSFEEGQLVASGDVALSYSGSTFDGGVEDGKLRVATDLRLTAAVTLELRAETSGDVEYSKLLAVHKLPEISLGGSVRLLPFVSLSLDVVGHADAGACASVVMPLTLEAGFDSASAEPIYAGAPHSFRPSFGAPDLASAVGMDVTAKASVELTFLIEVDAITVGGPSLDFEAGVEIGVEPESDPWVAADAFVAASGRWVLDPAAEVELEFTEFTLLPHETTRIAELPGPLTDLETTRWSRIYDLGTSEEAVSLLPTAGGFTVVGPGPGTGRAWLSELDGNGNPTWENLTVVQANGLIRPAAMTTATDGDLLLVGADASTGVGMRLERYAPLGTPRWALKMNSPSGTTTKWNAVLPTETNGAVLGGTITYSGNPSVRRPMFAEVDSSGAILWQTELDLGVDAKSPDICALGRTPTGDILAVGSVTSTTSPLNAAGTLNNQNILITRIAADGTALSARALGGRGTEYGLTLATFPDGSYVVGGSVPTQGLDKDVHASWLGRFSGVDSPLWSHTYASTEDEGLGWAELATVSISPEGKIYAGGHAHIGQGRNAWLMQVDDLGGMPYWFKSLRGGDEDHLNGIAALSNGLVAFGRTKSFNDKPVRQTDFWVSRTNIDGMLTFSHDVGMFAQNDSVGWAAAREQSIQSFGAIDRPGVLSLVPVVVAVAPVSTSVELVTR